jgi:hypothetical protein
MTVSISIGSYTLYLDTEILKFLYSECDMWMNSDELGQCIYASTNFICSNYLAYYKIMEFWRTGKPTFCCVKSQTFVPWGNMCKRSVPTAAMVPLGGRNLYAHSNNRATGPSGIYAVASCQYSKSDGWSLSC